MSGAGSGEGAEAAGWGAAGFVAGGARAEARVENGSVAAIPRSVAMIRLARCMGPSMAERQGSARKYDDRNGRSAELATKILENVLRSVVAVPNDMG